MHNHHMLMELNKPKINSFTEKAGAATTFILSCYERKKELNVFGTYRVIVY